MSNTSKVMIGVFVIVIVVGMLFSTGILKKARPQASVIHQPKAPVFTDLSATVRFVGSQIVVTNTNDFDWTNIEMLVNGEGFKKGYKVEISLMIPGMEWPIEANHFVDPDGTRFNTYTTKPIHFQIWADVKNQPRGYAVFTW